MSPALSHPAVVLLFFFFFQQPQETNQALMALFWIPPLQHLKYQNFSIFLDMYQYWVEVEIGGPFCSQGTETSGRDFFLNTKINKLLFPLKSSVLPQKSWLDKVPQQAKS